MCNIKVGRYHKPTDEERAAVGPDINFPADRWMGWIEPEDLSWIAFIDADGRPVFFLDRNPETGGVLDAA